MNQKNNLSRLLFFLGLLCFVFVGVLIVDRMQNNTVSFDRLPVTSQVNTQPDGIEISTQQIRLAVVSKKVEKSFPTSKTTAIHIQGTNIYYAHNWPNLFGNLKKIKINDPIVIHFSNGQIKKYLVTQTESVWPSDTSILNQNNSETIIVYTCTGVFDIKRLVIVAKSV